MTEHEDNATPAASDDDIKRMDADTEQNANPGAAIGEQGPGQHDDQDATDVETKQDHPKTQS